MRSTRAGTPATSSRAAAEVRQPLGGYVGVGDAGHHLSCTRTGEVHRREGAGDVQQPHVELPVGQPPRHPSFECPGVAARHGDEELVVCDPHHGAVVDDHTLVVQHHSVAHPADRLIGEPVRVETLEQLDRLRTGDPELAERRDVDQPHPVAHRVDLGLGRAEMMGAAPVSGPHDVGPHIGVEVVHRGLLARGAPGAGERAQLDRRPRRARGGALRLGERRAGRSGAQALRRHHAGLALTRSHRDRRVALQQLHRRETLGHCLPQLLVGHIHAQARELLAVADADLGRQHHRVGRSGRRLAQRGDPRRDVAPRRAQRRADLEPRETALRDGTLVRDRARHGAHGVNALGQPLRQERLGALVERHLGARHRQQVRAGGGETGEHHEVAGDPRSARGARGADRHAGHPSPPRRGEDRRGRRHPVALPRRRLVAQVDHRHRRPGLDQGSGRLVAGLARGEHDRRPAGEHAVAPHEQLDRRGEHHAGEIVVREDDRLFDRAGRHHQVPRPHAVQGARARGGHDRTLEDAERRGARQDPDPGGRGFLSERGGRARLGSVTHRSARLALLFQDERVEAGRRGLGRRGEPRRAASDHEHVGVERDALARLVILLARHLPEAGLRPDERLDQSATPTGDAGTPCSRSPEAS